MQEPGDEQGLKGNLQKPVLIRADSWGQRHRQAASENGRAPSSDPTVEEEAGLRGPVPHPSNHRA